LFIPKVQNIEGKDLRKKRTPGSGETPEHVQFQGEGKKLNVKGKGEAPSLKRGMYRNEIDTRRKGISGPVVAQVWRGGGKNRVEGQRTVGTASPEGVLGDESSLKNGPGKSQEGSTRTTGKTVNR